jgi:addiction module RelE/StbE family toxin
MILDYHPKFKKQYKKLPPAQKRRLDDALKVFRKNPHSRELYNHPLTGKWKGYRSIAFGGDWRAHFKLVGSDEAIFVAVGTHSQLYK